MKQYQRSLRSRNAQFNGVPVFFKLEEFSPPAVKKTTEDVRGGRLMADKIMTGFEAMEWTVKLAGAGIEELNGYGVHNDEPFTLSVWESYSDEYNNAFKLEYIIRGQILEVEQEGISMGGKPSHTVKGSARYFKQTENNQTIYEIDINRGIYDLGKGNINAIHNQNVNLN